MLLLVVMMMRRKNREWRLWNEAVVVHLWLCCVCMCWYLQQCNSNIGHATSWVAGVAFAACMGVDAWVEVSCYEQLHVL